MSESRTVGHLIQICERWIYSACLCFGLDRQEQEQSGFCYAYSVFQLEYSHNLLFREGAQMDRFFQAFGGPGLGAAGPAAAQDAVWHQQPSLVAAVHVPATAST